MTHPAPKTPLYRKVESIIRRDIEAGRYKPGARLPNERNLALEHGVSRPTARQALSALKQQRIIEQIQGRGTFVAHSVRQVAYLGVIAVGPTARHNPYVATVVTEMEHSAQQHGLRVTVRWVPQVDQAEQALREICEDPMVVGGIITGLLSPQLAKKLHEASSLPWVMIGELFGTARHAPMIHQVVGDDRQFAQIATQYLIDQGVEHPALFVSGASLIWSRDQISAYRTVLDDNQIPAGDQMVCDLNTRNIIEPTDTQERWRHHCTVCEKFLADWRRTDRWPTGIAMSGWYLSIFDFCVKQDPVARDHLRDVTVAAMDFHERLMLSPVDHHREHTGWVLLRIADMTQWAVERIQNVPKQDHLPVRQYVGTAYLEETGVLLEIS